MKNFKPKQIMGIKNMAIIPMGVRILSVDRCSPSLGPICSDRITAIVGKLYWNREDCVQQGRYAGGNERRELSLYYNDSLEEGAGVRLIKC